MSEIKIKMGAEGTAAAAVFIVIHTFLFDVTQAAVFRTLLHIKIQIRMNFIALCVLVPTEWMKRCMHDQEEKSSSRSH